MVDGELSSIQEAGTYKSERVITSPQRNLISVQRSDEPVLNFCANNYLGLSDHPTIIDAAKRSLDDHGFGVASVRFICGTQDIHKTLEAKIAEFHGTEDAILYGSCFDANAGIFEVLLTPEDAVISDQLNHASIIDGIRLCKAQKHRYTHMDMEDLEAKLKDTQSVRTRLVVTDGVFSMDGDVAPLKDICDLVEKYDATLLIDECHATGFFGAHGRGTPEYFDVEGRVDIINSTLGKALGGATGGYTAGPRGVIDLLRQRSRPYLFSNSIAPAVAAAGIATFDMLQENNELVERLAENTRHFRTAMGQAGFNVLGDEACPIAPVLLGDARLASAMADDLLKQNIYVIGFSYPVVPKGQARIRVQLSASHTPEDVERAVSAFVQVGKEHGVL